MLAWAVLRTWQALLSTRALSGPDFLPGPKPGNHDRYFVVEELQNHKTTVQEESNTMACVEDHYPHIDAKDFYRHVMNTSRVIGPAKALTKLSVSSSVPLSQSKYTAFRPS